MKNTGEMNRGDVGPSITNPKQIWIFARKCFYHGKEKRVWNVAHVWIVRREREIAEREERVHETFVHPRGTAVGRRYRPTLVVDPQHLPSLPSGS